MFKKYLRFAIRNLEKNKFFTFINIVGLAMAMTVGLFVLTVISDLTTFDNFHHNADHIYRITTVVKFGQRDPGHRATCALPIADELENQFSSQAAITKISKQLNGLGKANKKEIPVNGYFTDADFFNVFTFPLVAGSSELSNPNTVVITEALSQKFFGTENPTGQIMTIGNLGDFLIIGIMEDVPKNSHMQFELLVSITSLERLERENRIDPSLHNWDEFFSTYVYILFNDGTSLSRLERSLQTIEKNANARFQDIHIRLFPQSLKNIVPGPDLSSQIGPKMSYLPIMIMLALALVILASACINYTNLALARSLKRAKEVGLRKIFGGSQVQLFEQFLTETMIVAMFALIVSVLIFYFLKPGFLQAIPRANEILTLKFNPWLIFSFIGLAIIAGLMAGLLPASILSRIPSVSALKNAPAKDTKKITFRKGLIVFQFTLSLFLIIGIIVVFRQYQFAVNKDLGFTKKNILVVPLKSTDFEIFKNEFSAFPGVASITGSSELIGSYSTNGLWMKSGSDSTAINYMRVDNKFISDLGIKIRYGSNFSKGTESSRSIIINEKFSAMLGNNHSEVIGSQIDLNNEFYTITGIANDFHYMHLEEPIKPFFFMCEQSRINYAYLTMDNSSKHHVNGPFNNKWKELNPDESFEPIFLDDHIESTYLFYTNFMKIFGYLAFLAIAIGCLGLLGMTLYAAEVRQAEIAIRKVMGASESSLIYLLSRSFVLLLMVACSIATPLGYLAFNELISVSAYHISIGVIELGTGICLLLGLGIMVIVSQTIRTTRANPANVLKAE